MADLIDGFRGLSFLGLKDVYADIMHHELCCQIQPRQKHPSQLPWLKLFQLWRAKGMQNISK